MTRAQRPFPTEFHRNAHARTASPHEPLAEHAPKPRDATLPEVVGAVFSSFLGIRKGKAMQKDAVSIKPHQVVLVGIVLAARVRRVAAPRSCG